MGEVRHITHICTASATYTSVCGNRDRCPIQPPLRQQPYWFEEEGGQVHVHRLTTCNQKEAEQRDALINRSEILVIVCKEAPLG